MKLKVIKKQGNIKDCFVCGYGNEAGIKANFFEMEDKSVIGVATAGSIHQSYPLVVHGGVSSALLDEAMGRAFLPYADDILGVTVEMTTRFLKPVPYGVQLLVPTRVVDTGDKVYTCEGSIVLPDGTVAMTATAKYFKVNTERLASMGASTDMFVVDPAMRELTEIEIPEKA